MPGDPKEARAHAANCMQLAETASSPTVQKTFADLATQWNRLANELDDAHALLKALNELDLKETTTSDGDLSSMEKATANQQAPRIASFPLAAESEARWQFRCCDGRAGRRACHCSNLSMGSKPLTGLKFRS